jgi:hypothetical protein
MIFRRDVLSMAHHARGGIGLAALLDERFAMTRSFLNTVLYMVGFALLWSAPAGAAPCAYDGDDFIVLAHGSKKSYSADDDFQGAAISCSSPVSLMYDGDDVIVYDENRESFSTYSAEDGFGNSAASAWGGLGVVYDGDDVIVYDADKAGFSSYSAEDFNTHAVAVVGNGRLLVYDGDDVIGYCPGYGFTTASADDNVFATATGYGNDAGISVDGDFFHFRESGCSITTSSW